MVKDSKKRNYTPFQSVYGTHDTFGDSIDLKRYLEYTVRSVMRIYNYHEIRTPTFEQTDLFARSIGRNTDIVGKEMYTFADRGDENLTLRPEGTAPVIRAYIQHHLKEKGPVTKLYYIGPMYRRERPQKGRMRQFDQFGVEIIGSGEPQADVEVMVLFDTICEKLGIAERNFLINSVGCTECRPTYRETLTSFLVGIKNNLCETCQERMTKNPLRILDCKNDECRAVLQSAPFMLDHLCEECKEHFEEVCRLLDELGISYKVDRYIIRGLDYYTRTAFEMASDILGAQSSFMGGGRYDNLVEELGGNPTPAVGFAAGTDRILLILEELGKTGDQKDYPLVWVALQDETIRNTMFTTLNLLRKKGIPSDGDLLKRSLKAQMKEANRSGARYTLIFKGLTEVTFKNMETGEQEDLSVLNAIERIESELR